MNRVILSFCLMLLFTQAFAQNVSESSLEWVSEMKAMLATNCYSIKTSEDQVHYFKGSLRKENGQSTTLHNGFISYDLKTQEMVSIKLSEPKMYKKDIFGYHMFKGKPMLFYRYTPDHSSMFRHLYVRDTYGSKPQMIAKLKKEWAQTLFPAQMCFSPDSSKILLAKSVVKYDEEEYSYLVLDKDFKELERGTCRNRLDYPKKSYKQIGSEKVIKYHISNDGTIYKLARKFHPEKKARSNNKYIPPYYYLDFQKITPERDTVEYDFSSLPSIFSYKTYINDKNELIISGTDYLKDTYQIKYFKFDLSTNRLKASGSSSFDIEYINERYSLNHTAKESGINRPLLLEMMNILPRAEGGYVLLFEFYDPYLKALYRDCRFDILAVGIDEKGEEEWRARIHKRQAMINSYGGYSSFYHIMNDGNIHFIYNDILDGKEESEKLTLDIRKESYVYHVKLDTRNGDMAKEILYEKKAEDPLFVPDGVSRISKDTFIVLGGSPKKLSAGRLKIKL